MENITVLGAGYMGSAITFPLAHNGHKVNLWGSWLDDRIIDSCRKGLHPKLKKPLEDSISIYSKEYLGEALKDSDIVFIGITSEGFADVLEKALEFLEPGISIFALTKGFAEHEGQVMLISKAAEKILSKKLSKKDYSWCSVGGPVKALELARFIPSISVYATTSKPMTDIIGSFKTDYYNIITTEDVTGVELSSALKNIYATGIGITDGIYLPEYENMYHNLSSWLYTQALLEMQDMIVLAGGREDTVLGFAGTGDLYVTAQSGRNRRLGELVGKGMEAEKAYDQMLAQDEVGEGYNALKLVFRWLRRQASDFEIKKRLPLLLSLYDIFFNLKEPKKTINDLFLNLGN